MLRRPVDPVDGLVHPVKGGVQPSRESRGLGRQARLHAHSSAKSASVSPHDFIQSGCARVNAWETLTASRGRKASHGAVTSAGVVFDAVSARSWVGLYAVMAVMVTSWSVGFGSVILAWRLLARMSRPM